MSYNFSDSRIQKQIPPTNSILESTFRETLEDPTSILEGAYIAYQVTDVRVDLGTGGTVDVPTPEENQFYHNTVTKESFRYSGGTWNLLTSSLLKIIVEAGFSSQWRKVNTLLREDHIELLIPKDYLPINIEGSQMLFVGFRNLLVSSEDVVPGIGLPLLEGGSRFYDRDTNTVIRIPFQNNCNFLPISEGQINELENSLNYDRNKHQTIHYIMSEFISYSSSVGDLNAPDINGTTLRF